MLQYQVGQATNQSCMTAFLRSRNELIHKAPRCNPEEWLFCHGSRGRVSLVGNKGLHWALSLKQKVYMPERIGVFVSIHGHGAGSGRLDSVTVETTSVAGIRDDSEKADRLDKLIMFLR